MPYSTYHKILAWRMFRIYSKLRKPTPLLPLEYRLMSFNPMSPSFSLGIPKKVSYQFVYAIKKGLRNQTTRQSIYIGILLKTDLIKLIRPPKERIRAFQPSSHERTFSMMSSKYIAFILPLKIGTPEYVNGRLLWLIPVIAEIVCAWCKALLPTKKHFCAD